MTKGLYFPGESYKTRSYYESILSNTGSAEFQHFTSDYNENVYNFSKMTIKQIISMEDWGISTMQEKIVSVNKVNMNYTYWDYIQAFHKVFCYNNEKLKHTWFLKICAKVFSQNLPNWFINWWALHGPTKKILPNNFLSLYKQWVKISPFLMNLYVQDHVPNIEHIDQMYFFIEFSVPWIHKWVPEVGYTPEENIPCLYRKYFHNFWDKLNRTDPSTGQLYGQELIDQIKNTIQAYEDAPKKGLNAGSSIKHIARRISIQDGNKQEMINEYLEDVKRNLMESISDFEKSDTSMKSGHSNNTTDAQSINQDDAELTESQLNKMEDFLASIKDQEKTIVKKLKGKDKV